MSKSIIDILLETFGNSENTVTVIHEECHEHRSLLKVGPQRAHKARAERIDKNFVV